MAIEFECQNCLAVLRTADGNAAIPARCPACRAPLTVPDGIPVDAPSADLVVCDVCGTRNVTEDEWCRNCGESFTADASVLQPDDETGMPDSPVPTFTVDQVVSRSWEIYHNEFGPSLLGSLVSWFTLFAGCILGLIPILLSLAIIGGPPRMRAAVIMPFLVLVLVFVVTYSQVGFMMYFDTLVRERRGTLAMLLRGGRLVFRVLALNVIFWLIVGVGLIAFVIPGLIAYSVFWPAHHVLVEQDCSVFQALDRARRLTRGHRGTLFLVSVVDALASAVSGIFTVGLGLLLSRSFSAILQNVAYLHLTGRDGPHAESPFAADDSVFADDDPDIEIDDDVTMALSRTR